MPSAVVEILNAAPQLLAAAALLFGLCGFWRGLDVRPPEREHGRRPAASIFGGPITDMKGMEVGNWA
jgi:hypothetical protein